jgi:hypothetical protein
MRHRRLHVQADPHRADRADHLQIGRLAITRESKNIRRRSGLPHRVYDLAVGTRQRLGTWEITLARRLDKD